MILQIVFQDLVPFMFFHMVENLYNCSQLIKFNKTWAEDQIITCEKKTKT